MRDCWYYFEFGTGNSYCVWIENVEKNILEFIYIMIIDSRDYDLDDVISRPDVTDYRILIYGTIVITEKMLPKLEENRILLCGSRILVIGTIIIDNILSYIHFHIANRALESLLANNYFTTTIDNILF